MYTPSDKESLYRSLGLDPTKVAPHEDGSISYNGDVYWDNKPFKVFPLRFRKVTGYFSCRGCTSLVSLEGGPQKVRSLDLEGTPIYHLPEDMEITDVWLDGPNDWVPTEKARKILQDFKSGITSDDDAGEVLLDRMNRPLWQIAYACDYLNRDIQV